MKSVISENIRTYRKALGLTQEQLAEAVGVTVGAVSKWESGLSHPDIGMLPALADFFEISIDILMGYQLNSRTATHSAEKIHQLRLEKKYHEAIAEAEKALQKFPNYFDIVYQSALLFQTDGIERGGQGSLRKSLELYRRACGMISQNTDPDISELLIQDQIGELYMLLGDMDAALDHLKKYNDCGINNGLIGCFLAEAKKADEAFPYLSDALISCVASLFRVVMGLANCYGDKGDSQAAIEVFLWMHSVTQGLKPPGKITYLDKMDAMVYCGCAIYAAGMNDAALDAQTAFSVTNAILEIQDLTRIIVTHRLEEALMKKYDKIYVLKNGQLDESGTFDELMNSKGYFYSLFTISQA